MKFIKNKISAYLIKAEKQTKKKYNWTLLPYDLLRNMISGSQLPFLQNILLSEFHSPVVSRKQCNCLKQCLKQLKACYNFLCGKIENFLAYFRSLNPQNFVVNRIFKYSYLFKRHPAFGVPVNRLIFSIL